VNSALLAAGALTVGIGAAHSYLGERYILVRLFRRNDLPKLFGSDLFTRRTLRFAWHLTTVAWWGFGAIFVVMAATSPGPGAWEAVGTVGATVFGASALVTAVGSRGRHLAWVVFVVIALALWLGTR
jgi:hypothetical protein